MTKQEKSQETLTIRKEQEKTMQKHKLNLRRTPSKQNKEPRKHYYQSLWISNTNFLTTLSELKSFNDDDLFIGFSLGFTKLRYLTLSFLGGVTYDGISTLFELFHTVSN